MADDGTGTRTAGDTGVTPNEAALDLLVARSLAASERGSRDAVQPLAPARSPWLWIALAIVLALLLGMLANPWFERQLRGVMPDALQDQLPKAQLADEERIRAMQARIDALEAGALARPAPPEPGAAAPSAAPGPEAVDRPAPSDARLAAVEAALDRLAAADVGTAERLDRLAADLAAATGGSRQLIDGVRELLLLSATRRLFDSGRTLGPLVPALEQRFALADPDAVAALSAWNSAPVTRQSLATRLAARADEAAPADGWWARVGARLASLVAVRPPDAVPARSLAQARAALSAGDLDAARAEMAAAPATIEGKSWLADARRLADAEIALARLEQAAASSVATVATAPPQSPSPAPAAPGTRQSPPLNAPAR